MMRSFDGTLAAPKRANFFLRAIVWIVVWVLVAVLFASQHVASAPFVEGRPIRWSKALQLPLIMAAYWGIISVFILRVINRYPLERRAWIASALIHLAIATFLSLVFISLSVTAMYWIASNSSYADTGQESNSGYETHSGFAWELTWWSLFWAFGRITFHSSMLIYFAILAVGQTFVFNRKLMERERLTSQLKVDLVSAQFDQLRAQLQPHFLFNTLSAISTFVGKDPQTARNMIVRLSDLLRDVVDQPSTKTRRLADEVDFLQNYIEIQSARFGSKFVFVERIDPRASDAQIPFLLIQPMVENSIKHGVCESASTCRVELNIGLSENHVQIRVTDDGPGHDPKSLTKGVGIQNTVSRLRHLYGDNHQFKIECEKGGGFSVLIVLPFQTAKESN